MRIQKAIMSVDDHPLYADFWPVVSKVWKKRFGIDPVLIYFGDEELDETYGEVIKVKPVPGIPTYFQAQWGRFWYTTLDEEAVHIVNDMDMFPISRSFFIDQIQHIDDDKYVHLFGLHRPVPVCYHVAKGRLYKKVLQLDDTFEESVTRAYNSGTYCISHMGFDRWGLDETYPTMLIEGYEGDDLCFLPNQIPNNNRLRRDRWNLNYSEAQFAYYVDCHCLRPYHRYKDEIDRVIEILTEGAS